MFRIGEFSKLTQVSIRMLRYYDEIGLLKPAFVDQFTGYRSYTVEQIPTLQKIILLRDLGCSIPQITDTLSHWNEETVEQQLNAIRLEINAQIMKAKQKLSAIDSALNTLHTPEFNSQLNFIIKQIPAIKIVSMRKKIIDYFAEGSLWQELTRQIQGESIAFVPNADTFAIYHDTEFKDQDVDVEVCVPVMTLGTDKLDYKFRITEPVDKMACAMVYGPFENIRNGYLAFASWINEHSGYHMNGSNRQICHRGPWNEENPMNYLTEIQIPISI